MTETNTEAPPAPELDPESAPEPDELGLDETGTELDVRPAIEAILLVADEPISEITLASVLGRPQPVITQTLRDLAQAYTEENRGFDLREVGGGWRYYTRPDYAEVVERFVLDGQQARLTQAALETLAVVAYRQPVSRTRVSAIRGVNCDGVMRTLLSRGLVEEAGTDGESQATLYRTTSYFLERLGLQSLDELPDLAPYLPEVDQLDNERETVFTPAPAPRTEPEPELPLAEPGTEAADPAPDRTADPETPGD